MTVEHAGRTNGHVAQQPSVAAAVADDEASGRGGMGHLLLPALLAVAAIFLIRRFAQRTDA